MRSLKRIISYVLVFAILLSLAVVPASAADSQDDGKMGFWEWAACVTSPAYNFYKRVMEYDPDGEDDSWHSGGMSRGGGAGRRGYEEYKKEIPVNGYSSDGSFLWYPTYDDLSTSNVFIWEWGRFSDSSVSYPFSSVLLTNFTYSLGTDKRTIHIYFSGSGSADFRYAKIAQNTFKAPVSGVYTVLPGTLSSYARYSNSLGSSSYSLYYDSTTPSHYVSGFGIKTPTLFCDEVKGGRCYFVTGRTCLPVYEVVPDIVDGDSAPDYTTIYNVNTRVTNNIFNETTNVYTNPTTGEEKTVNNWNYNYNDRSYELHLADGMTVKLEFGDLNINIDEISIGESGDTVTNNFTLDYTVEVPPSPSPSPSPSSSPSAPPAPSTYPSGPSRVFQNYDHKITQHYGNEGHNGVDVIPTSGMADTVIAHSEGTVVTIQTGQVNNTSATGVASWGNYVKIAHPNGMYTLYAHLASVDVEEGDTVYRGQPLGLMGDSGRAFGAHLHFEVYEAETTRINPEPYLNADLPGMETDQDGWTWWKGAWTDFRQWFSGAIGGGKTETIFTPGVDSGGEGEDDGWSFLDLLKAVVDGVWSFIKGVPGAIFGGLAGLIEGFSGIGSFFDAYDSRNPDSVFNVLTQGGEDLWD